jgi:hypothetical protein
MKVFSLNIIFLFSLSAIGQQFLNIKIDEGSGIGGPNEPTISISRDNPEVIVGGSNTKSSLLLKGRWLNLEKENDEVQIRSLRRPLHHKYCKQQVPLLSFVFTGGQPLF